MAGRRPKPIAIHQLNGNPRHFSQAELSGSTNPQVPLVSPEMPKGMPKAARREWRSIVPILMRMGVLNEACKASLKGYVLAYAHVEALEKKIWAEGHTYVTKFQDEEGNTVIGEIKANPAVSMHNTYLKTMKSFLIEFGLTPAALTKLKIQKSPEQDAMNDYLKNGGSSAASAPVVFKVPEPVKPEDMAGTEDES